MATFQVHYTGSFSAAHNLRSYHGAPEPLHGHNWKVEVRLTGTQLDAEDMLVDFQGVEEAFAAIAADYANRYLNEAAPFDRINPTSENLARVFFRRMTEQLPDRRVRVEAVTVWETPACGVTYSE